jgi:UDP-glucose 4-epimerase
MIEALTLQLDWQMLSPIAITGANGFVGKVLSQQLLLRGHVVTGIVRRAGSMVQGVHEWVYSGSDFEGLDSHWPSSLKVDVLIHLAARVHMMGETSANLLDLYRLANVDGTMRLAHAAHRAGVRRLVFVSSIKAVGERSHGRAIRESDDPAPTDPYGISKLEAERALFEFGGQSGLEIVVVRPPLVYGPGVRANFLRLMGAIARGLPLPLGAISAQRSLVYVENLADAITHCAIDPRAAGQTFHVTDGEDLSVAQLIRTLAAYLDAPGRLLPVPASWLRFAGKITGRTAVVDRLIGELRLDCSHIRQALDWHPPYTVAEGLKNTASWYRATH